MHGCEYKPNKDILNISGEIINKWYFVSTASNYTNFPSGVSWGFIKFLSFDNIRLAILVSGENHAISINTYINNKWGSWVQS